MPFTDTELNLDTGQFWQADFPRPVYEVVLERESIAIMRMQEVNAVRLPAI